MAGRLAFAALSTLLAAQAGCATRLDFDAVSAGRDDEEHDAGVGLDGASTPASEAGSSAEADADQADRSSPGEEPDGHRFDAGTGGRADAAALDGRSEEH